jgi:hypothetical protein
MGFVKAVVLFFRAMLVSRSSLAMENLALRQQLSVYKQSVKRPKLRRRGRQMGAAHRWSIDFCVLVCRINSFTVFMLWCSVWHISTEFREQDVSQNRAANPSSQIVEQAR